MNYKILCVGLLSCWADATTTLIGFRYYPELKESNPTANMPLELAWVLGSQTLILYGGGKMKVNPKLVNALALAPTIVPFGAAANNLINMAILEAKNYPWQNCPLLYPQTKSV